MNLFRLLPVAMLLLVCNMTVAQNFDLPSNIKLPKGLQADLTAKAQLVNQVVRKPQKAEYHTYDSLTLDWMHVSNFTYDYNNEGWKTEQVEINAFTTENTYRSTMEYDANGEVTLELGEVWDGTSWKPAQKTTYKYDTKGNQTEYLYESHTGTAWQLAVGERTTYQYDKQDNLSVKSTMFYNVNTQMWENFSKETYSLYINHIPTSIVTQYYYNNTWENETKMETSLDANNIPVSYTELTWDGSSWIPNYREYDLVWYDLEAEMPLSYKTQVYNDSTDSWINEQRVTAQYMSNMSFVMQYDTWDDSTGTYLPAYKFSMINDQYGNNTDFKLEMNFGIWLTFMHVNTVYTYDVNGDMLDMTVSMFDFSQFGLVPSHKYIYSDFAEYGNTTGIPTYQKFASVYPTVTDGMVYIDGESLSSSYSYEVRDMLGRTLRSGITSTSINISDIPSQALFLVIRNDNDAMMIQRIVKK